MAIATVLVVVLLWVVSRGRSRKFVVEDYNKQQDIGGGGSNSALPVEYCPPCGGAGGGADDSSYNKNTYLTGGYS